MVFGKLFGRKKLSPEEQEKLESEWYDQKSSLMESMLGKEHDMVGHAIIPFEVGGSLDLYYYPNGIEGTGIATKELAYACRKCPSNNTYDKYELVMFTRRAINLDDSDNENSDFGKAHRTIKAVLNPIALYSQQAVLNPGETSEFPEDFEGIGGKCLLFSAYSDPESEEFGLLVVIEIFRSEMEYAREHSGAQLIQLLTDRSVYPYSDLDRDAVV